MQLAYRWNPVNAKCHEGIATVGLAMVRPNFIAMVTYLISSLYKLEIQVF